MTICQVTGIQVKLCIILYDQTYLSIHIEIGTLTFIETERGMYAVYGCNTACVCMCMLMRVR